MKRGLASLCAAALSSSEGWCQYPVCPARRGPLDAIQPVLLGDPPTGNGEDTYLIGPRIAPYPFHRLTPYGKVLVGLGSGSYLTSSTFAIAYGGGVDYRLTRRFTLRCFDFEFQQWHVTPTLYPYGGSVGLSYKIF